MRDASAERSGTSLRVVRVRCGSMSPRAIRARRYGVTITSGTLPWFESSMIVVGNGFDTLK